MTFKWRELSDSRPTTAAEPTAKLRYLASGTMDEVFVQAYALQATPVIYTSLWGVLYRKDILVDPDGYNRWQVTVPYGKHDTQNGNWTWSFDTTGGSFHIKASKGTVAKYPSNAPDFKQLIGVHGDEVDGADVVIPSMKLNVTYKHPQGVVNMPFAMTIFALTGKVNGTPMFTRPAGEVLFLGGTGSDGTSAEAEAGYQFAISPNLQGLIVGAITNIQKDGWDIAWIKWKDATDSGKPVKHPDAVYIERVYERTDLAAALGFGG
jgi:hypothetical protein